MRFNSRMISPSKNENDMNYIISYFCGDDSIMIYLKNEKKGGFIGGKFLEKR